jgi:hypothetical protein
VRALPHAKAAYAPARPGMPPTSRQRKRRLARLVSRPASGLRMIKALASGPHDSPGQSDSVEYGLH